MSNVATPTTSETAGRPDPIAAAKKPPSRVREWTRLIAVTGTAQVAVQAIGFACGILVIRLLPTDEYALYTLANTMLGTMALLADGGIAAGVMSQGGKVWDDRAKLGSVLVTGMALRKKFAVFSLLVATPILFYLLHHHGASWLTATLIVLSLIPAFFSALSGTLLEIVPKLRQDIGPLQRIQVASNAIRLALSGLFVFAFPFAGVAILASGAAQVVANYRLRKLSNDYADRTREEDPAVHAGILKVVRRQMPESIYYCLSGQITVWLISIFGNTESIAQIGALGRLAQVFAIPQVMFATLAIPRFSRLPAVRPLLLTRYAQVLAAVAVFGACVSFVAWKSPHLYLFVLGDQYRDLSQAALLTVVAGSCGLLTAVAYHLNLSRGAIVPPAVTIAYSIANQIAAIAAFDMSSITGVLMVGVWVAASQLLLHTGYAILWGLK